MPYPRRLADAFAAELASAVHILDDKLHVWQVAARRARVPDEEVRVIHERELVFLLGQEWVVFQDDTGKWRVRPWQAEDDELYESAQEMWALDDPSDADA